jgi:hypothetical protein
MLVPRALEEEEVNVVVTLMAWAVGLTAVVLPCGIS